ncbi:MAG: DMT family transporter [Acidimicrobiia bacterium]
MRQRREPGAAPAVAVALAAGVCGAVQPKINAVLGVRVGSALVASLVNFTAALTVVTIILSLRPGSRRTLRQLRLWSVPRWTLTAGLCGALIATAGAVAVETIGVAVFSVAFFAGQITFGLLVDRLGIAPGGRRPVTTARLQAALVAVIAVVVSQIGRPVGEFAPALVALVVAAGAALAFQSAFNGRIAAATGDAFAATAVNVMVGIAALTAIVLALAGTGHVDAPHWPVQPWLYAGGVLGVTIVLSLAIATPALGVLRATLAMLAAQLVIAFAVDWVVEHEGPTPGVIAGAALIVVAVTLVGRRPAADRIGFRQRSDQRAAGKGR